MIYTRLNIVEVMGEVRCRGLTPAFSQRLILKTRMGEGLRRPLDHSRQSCLFLPSDIINFLNYRLRTWKIHGPLKHSPSSWCPGVNTKSNKYGRVDEQPWRWWFSKSRPARRATFTMHTETDMWRGSMTEGQTDLARTRTNILLFPLSLPCLSFICSFTLDL